MARPGPPPTPPNVLAMRGSHRANDGREQVVVPLHGEPRRPAWLKGEARKVWDRKVTEYHRRAQGVVGMEDALAQYCQLEANLISMHKRSITPPMAMVNGHRVWAHEFFDTPAATIQKGGTVKPGNPFKDDKPPGK